MEHRSKASRDLAAYIEKRDAALARARQLRLLKQMGGDDRSDEPRLKPIHTLTSYSEPKKDDVGDVYSRLNELENNHRALKSDNSRLQQTVQKLSQKVALLEQQLKGAAPVLPSSSFSAEGSEPLPSSRRSSGRKTRNSSPPPMDFTLDTPNNESPGFTTPPRSGRAPRHDRLSTPSPSVRNSSSQLAVKFDAAKFDDIPISPAGEKSTGSNSVEQGALLDHPEPLFPCKTCGRRFRAESLQKHTDNCVKVFQTKRKEFKVEVLNEEDAKDLRQAYRPTHSIPVKKAPTSKWRQDRAKLKQTLLGGSSNGPKEVVQDMRVTCPHCSRKFGDTAAERHIPKCKDTVNKPTMLFRKTTRF